MNAQQFAQQIRHELASLTWVRGADDPVFGADVFVFAGAAPDPETMPGDFPFSLVSIGGGTPDDELPDLILQDFSVISVAEVGGDAWGESALVGFNRSDYGKSANAGALELGERARSAVERLTGIDGCPVVATSTSVAAASFLSESTNVAYDSFSVQAMCTSRPFYRSPRHLQVSGSTWTWTDESSQRYDFVQYYLVEKVGSLPSTSPSDGTVVYTGADPTADHVPVSGRTYTAFAGYHPYNTALSPVAYSQAPIGSYRVIA